MTALLLLLLFQLKHLSIAMNQHLHDFMKNDYTDLMHNFQSVIQICFQRKPKKQHQCKLVYQNNIFQRNKNRFKTKINPQKY